MHALKFTAKVRGTKNRQYKSSTANIHIRLYLQTLANNLSKVYKIKLVHVKAGITFGDVLAAKRNGDALLKQGVAVQCKLEDFFTEQQ